MKMEENLIIEETDLKPILETFVRTYRFYSKNKLPGMIVIKKCEDLKIRVDSTVVAIHVVFEGEEVDNSDRSLGTWRNRKAPRANRPSSNNEPQSDTKE